MSVIAIVFDVIFLPSYKPKQIDVTGACFPNYYPYSIPPKFKGEIKIFVFDLAKKTFKHKSHPYG